MIVARLSRLVVQRSGAICLLWVVLLILGGLGASRLRLDNDLLNLLPTEIQAVQVIKELQSRDASLQFMYMGLVRPDDVDSGALKQFAEAIGPHLSASQWIESEVAVGIDITRIAQAAPLFLDAADLKEAGERLDDKLKAERKKRSGFYLDLEDDVDDDADSDEPDATAAGQGVTQTTGPFDALVAKYRSRFQMGESKTGSQDMLGSVRMKTNADGTTLYYMSENTRMLTFLFQPVFPPSELEHYPALMADVDAAVASARKSVSDGARIETFVGGAYALQWDQRDATLRDAGRSASAAGLLILLIIAITLARFRQVLLVFGSLTAGLLVAFGMTWLVVGTVNVITAFLLAILGGLGIDFGLYFATRYRGFAASGRSRQEAVERAWRHTAVPSFMGAVTTAAVMLLLVFGRFRGFAELGAIATIGIIATWLAMYTLLPALVARWGHVPAVATPEAPGASPASWFNRFSPAGRLAPFFALACLLATLVAAWSARDVKFAYTGKELTVEGQKSYQVDRKILEHYGETVDQTIVVARTEARARRIHAYFEQRFGEFKSIRRYESTFTYLPPLAAQQSALAAMGPLRQAIAKMPGRSDDPDENFLYQQARRMAKAEPITEADLPSYLARVFTVKGADGSLIYLGHVLCSHWLWEVSELERFVRELESVRVDGEPLVTTGRAQVFLHLINIVQQETVVFTALGSLLILLLFWVQARSLRFAVLSMLPLLSGVLWALGLLPHVGEGGLSLSFMNLIVVPMLVGLGVAYGVHLVYAYRLHGDPELALRVVFRPVLGSASTTLAGWASLLLASMVGMRGMGWLATLGMIGVAIASLVALPALLALLHRAGAIRADRLGTSPSPGDRQRAR